MQPGCNVGVFLERRDHGLISYCIEDVRGARRRSGPVGRRVFSVSDEASMGSTEKANAFEWWSLANAAGMIASTLLSGWVGQAWPLLVGGAGLLGGLIVLMWGQWAPGGGFGAANFVTLGRVGLLALLPAAASAGAHVLIGFSLVILVTDGLDGWLARKTRQSSEFGAFFDKESDALFLLVLCGLAAFRGRLPFWILGVGLLRYAFVILIFLISPSEKTEERRTLARYVYGGMIAALLFSFLPYPEVYRPVVIGATALLAVSFGRSLWTAVPRRQTSHS